MVPWFFPVSRNAAVLNVFVRPIHQNQKAWQCFCPKSKFVYLNDARQFCRHKVKPKAIPFIILLTKAKNELKPLGVFESMVDIGGPFLFPLTGLLVKLLATAQGDGRTALTSYCCVCCFAVMSKSDSLDVVTANPQLPCLLFWKVTDTSFK